MIEQFSVEQPFDSEAQARYSSRVLVVDLLADLKRRGYQNFHSPPRPGKADIWDEFGGCRIIVQYIADGSGLPKEYWNKFLCRVDTLATKAERA